MDKKQDKNERKNGLIPFMKNHFQDTRENKMQSTGFVFCTKSKMTICD